MKETFIMTIHVKSYVCAKLIFLNERNWVFAEEMIISNPSSKIHENIKKEECLKLKCTFYVKSSDAAGETFLVIKFYYIATIKKKVRW